MLDKVATKFYGKSSEIEGMEAESDTFARNRYWDSQSLLQFLEWDEDIAQGSLRLPAGEGGVRWDNAEPSE